MKLPLFQLTISAVALSGVLWSGAIAKNSTIFPKNNTQILQNFVNPSKYTTSSRSLTKNYSNFTERNNFRHFWEKLSWSFPKSFENSKKDFQNLQDDKSNSKKMFQNFTEIPKNVTKILHNFELNSINSKDKISNFTENSTNNHEIFINTRQTFTNSTTNNSNFPSSFTSRISTSASGRGVSTSTSKLRISPRWNGHIHRHFQSPGPEMHRNSSDKAKEKNLSLLGRHIKRWMASKLSVVPKIELKRKRRKKYFGLSNGDAKKTFFTVAEKYRSSSNNKFEYLGSGNKTKLDSYEGLFGDCSKMQERFLSNFEEIRDVCPRFARTFEAIFDTICNGSSDIHIEGSSKVQDKQGRRYVPFGNTKQGELKRKERYRKRLREHMLSGPCRVYLQRLKAPKIAHSKRVPPDIAMAIKGADYSSLLFKIPNKMQRRRASSASDGPKRSFQVGNAPYGDLNFSSPSQRKRRASVFSSSGNQTVVYSRSSRSTHEVESYPNNYYPHLYPYTDPDGLQYLEPEVHIKHPDPVYIYEDTTVKPGQYIEVYPGAYQPTYTYSKFPRSYWLFHVLKGLFTIWEALQTIAILYLLWKVAVLTVLPREVGPTFLSTLEHVLHYLGVPTTSKAFQMRRKDGSLTQTLESLNIKGVNQTELEIFVNNSTVPNQLANEPNSRTELLNNFVNGTKIGDSNSKSTQTSFKKKQKNGKQGSVFSKIIKSSKGLRKSANSKGDTEEGNSATYNFLAQEQDDVKGIISHVKLHWRDNFGCLDCNSEETGFAAPSVVLTQPTSTPTSTGLLFHTST